MFKRIVLIIISLIFLSASAEAAVSLSVSPIEGGNTIRFGRVKDPARSNKEVRLRITTDLSEQYQVFQRVLTPLVNERGEQLDRDVILVSGLTGSNASGTVHVLGVDKLGYADQLIYTSSANGDSDSFVLVYQIDQANVTKSGQFIGKLLYSVRPLGGGAQDEVVLNIYLEASGELSVEVDGSHGQARARVDALANTDQAYIRLKFKDNTAKLKIYQDLIQAPRSEDFYEMEPEFLLMQVVSNEGGARLAAPTPIERREILLYESDALEDEVTVIYNVDPESLGQMRAGNYVAQVRFRLEAGRKTEFVDVDLEVEMAPVFELATEFPPEGMAFTRLLPNEPPQYKEITVKVSSNTGKPFFVSQNVGSALTNEEGKQVKAKFFTMRQELLSGESGNVEHSEFVPVDSGQSTLFYSDAQGSSAKFKVIYRMRPYLGMEAGDYEASFVYTLGEI